MFGHRGKILRLPPNRVWRSYLGGRLLDAIGGCVVASGERAAAPADTHFPEDWVGSVTRAINPNPSNPREGISRVLVDAESEACDLAELIASDATYFLGDRHIARYGTDPMLLVKLLDPSIRLHFQVHPSAELARRLLDSPSGKTEAYHILAIREDVAEPYLYLGFQRPPAPADLKRMIESQDIPAIERCFDKIPVRPGDTFIVPGGCPHALGEGLLLVEVQEPSDLVVRFEFERGGYVLPEEARFMKRDVDFGLQIFDYTPRSRADVLRTCRVQPRRLRDHGADSWTDALIGPEQTNCFRVEKTRLTQTATMNHDAFHLAIVTAGTCTVTAGDDRHTLHTYDKILVPAGLEPLMVTPAPTVEFLQCFPPS